MANERQRRTSPQDTPAAWLKVARVAAELDCSTRTVKRWIADGKLETMRLTPDGEWRISRASLDAYLASLRSRCFASTTPGRTTFNCDHPAADAYEVTCPICGALRTDEAVS